MMRTLGNKQEAAAHREPVENGGAQGRDAGHSFAISVDRNGLFRWTLFNPGGQILAASSVGFASELTAERAVRDVASSRSVRVEPRFRNAA